LTNLQLGPQSTVDIKGQAYTLAALVQALIGYQPDDLQMVYDERGQLQVGRYLYTQIFGVLDATERRRLRDTSVDARIVTEDEHLARLPWALLVDESVFLSTVGWSVALSHTLPHEDYELPPSPRLLVIAPQPVGVGDTKADWHLEALETLLGGADPLHVRGQHLRVVETWEAFTQAVTAFRPHVVYYYGHGIGNPQTSRLVFASAQGNSRLDKPIADMAACLRQQPDGPPLLVYLNCCQGDAGGLLGAGRVLGEQVPAVITNRTIARIDAAHGQGIALWRSILLDGAPPHTAVAKMHRNLIAMGLSFSNERWMTPVLHGHYSTWRANPPRPRSRLEYDPHWRLKFDRVKQFGQVYYLTTQMLRERRPRSLAYVWYGQTLLVKSPLHKAPPGVTRDGVQVGQSVPASVCARLQAHPGARRAPGRPSWPWQAGAAAGVFAPNQGTDCGADPHAVCLGTASSPPRP
jgi:CHAT domain